MGPHQPAGTVRAEGDHGEVWLSEGDLIEVCRRPARVRFRTRQPVPPAAVLHPLFGLPAAVASRWLGRYSLHGAAFQHAGRAWALLGGRGAGKSSTLAHLLGRGHPAVSDDVLIVSGTTVFSGPRSVDLREDASTLGGEPLGLVGGRARWRLRPDACPPSLTLGGFVQLGWGDRVVIRSLEPEARLRRLLESSVFGPASGEAEQLLELAALPAWECARPRSLAHLDEVAARILAALPSRPQPNGTTLPTISGFVL